MADDFIAIETIGDEELLRALRALPDEMQNAVIEDVNEYALNVLRTYPSQRYISRKAAYGTTFFTDKQRRFFFAALKDGSINVPYKRTQGLRRGWRVEGQGPTSFLVNETPYADLIMGEGQSRHAEKIGWKKAINLIEERMERILRIAQSGVARAIRKVGLK